MIINTSDSFDVIDLSKNTINYLGLKQEEISKTYELLGQRLNIKMIVQGFDGFMQGNFGIDYQPPKQH